MKFEMIYGYEYFECTATVVLPATEEVAPLVSSADCFVLASSFSVSSA